MVYRRLKIIDLENYPILSEESLLRQERDKRDKAQNSPKNRN